MYVTDAYGKWLVEDRFKQLIEPSQAWIDAEPEVTPTPPEPTPEEKIAQLEQQLALTDTTLLEFMEIMLGGM
ncbi:hypothetical protein [Desulfotomaculum sp. 1211_IL3151]|uniref:hypothetical protein n=1 Tax=Desulfotomaculum sp. 1211_IL3151 TaxID=3084055 RepID=UPI002FDB0EE5